MPDSNTLSESEIRELRVYAITSLLSLVLAVPIWLTFHWSLGVLFILIFISATIAPALRFDVSLTFGDVIRAFYTKNKVFYQKSLEENERMYTQKYDEEDAKQFADDMRHNVRAHMLRHKTAGKAPLDYLNKGEKPKYLLAGFDLDIDDNDEGHQSQLFVTDKKVVMIASSITGKRSQYTVSFNDIIGLSVQRRLASQIRIETAGHSYKISAAASAPKLADEVVDYIGKRKEQINTDNQESENEGSLDKLGRLADLRDRGAITKEEFEDKKQNLIDEI
jgi:hypothetical protein